MRNIMIIIICVSIIDSSVQMSVVVAFLYCTAKLPIYAEFERSQPVPHSQCTSASLSIDEKRGCGKVTGKEKPEDVLDEEISHCYP
jgi:hypothetical protein